MNGTVVVFAKVPQEGKAKSRIALEAGRPATDRIYAELLSLTARTVKSHDHFISCDGKNGPGGLKKIFPAAAGFLRQEGGDLGSRLRDALEAVARSRPGPFCAIGTDCPDLTRSDIDDAFRLVEGGRDVVIGPARDGGYYLIALRDPGCGVFSAAGWGKKTLLAETLAILEERKFSHALLAVKGDIDRFDDWKAWKARRRVPRRSGEDRLP
jgi:uncharacterized protein